MNRLALLYAQSQLAAATPYSESLPNQMQFQTLLKFMGFLNNEFVGGRTLTGRGYSSRKYSYSEHEVTIAADELDAVAKAFFEAWSVAPFKYIADLDLASPVYCEVMIESGRLPWTYPDSLEAFAQLEFKLTEKAVR